MCVSFLHAHCMCICMWLCCALCLCTNTKLWLENTANPPHSKYSYYKCIPPMITYWERRESHAKIIQWLWICIKPACMTGTVRYYYTATHHAWAIDALGCDVLGVFWAYTKPHWCWLLRVFGLTPALPQRDVDTHSAPSFQWGARAGKLHYATDSAHFYPLLPLSSIFFLFFCLTLLKQQRKTQGCVGGSLNLHVYQKDMNRQQAGFPKQPHLDHALNPFVK